MKKIMAGSVQMFSQIYNDSMSAVACIAPLLCALFIKLGIPEVEKIIENEFTLSPFFSPYYRMFDLFIAMMTPSMFSFAGSMVMLGEIDDNLSGYFSVTPLGKGGYLFSRLGIPAVLSLAVTPVLLCFFSLTRFSLSMLITVTIISALQGLISSMLVVSLSQNKLEGMAVNKMAGLIIMGIPIPFFITGNAQYLLFFLPSFWIAKTAQENNYFFALLAALISAVWMFLLYKKFAIKIGK